MIFEFHAQVQKCHFARIDKLPNDNFEPGLGSYEYLASLESKSGRCSFFGGHIFKKIVFYAIFAFYQKATTRCQYRGVTNSKADKATALPKFSDTLTRMVDYFQPLALPHLIVSMITPLQ